MKTRGMFYNIAVWSTAGLLYSGCGGVEPQKSSRSYGPITDTDGGGGGNGDQTVNTPTPDDQKFGLTSEEAFKISVYPVVTANCSNCHRANAPSMSVQPYFAALNPTEAHTAAVDGKKVDLKSTGASRMYQRLKTDRHQCWSGDCEKDAVVMLAALNGWVEHMKTKEDHDAGGSKYQTGSLLAANAEQRQAGNDPSTILIEAEMATLTAPMAAVNDATTSGGRFIQVANNGQNLTLANNAAGAGIATFSFTITNPGTYTVFGLASAPTTADQSFFVALDAGALVPWILPVTTAFTWSAANNNNAALSFALQPGAHTITVRQRQDGTRLDRLAVTTNIAFTGPPKNGIIKVLKYDLSAITGKAGVSFEIELEDFDQQTLKFRNPRIISATAPIRVQGVHLLLNGQDDPRNATYSVVDTTVQPPGALLSTAAMIVLPDLGTGQDKFSFRFDLVE